MPAEREEFPLARVAALARLSLSPDEAALYQEQFAQILALVDRVTAADLGAPSPVPAPDDAPAQERPDVVRPSLAADEALANAPGASKHPSLVRVPKVLK